ncbi:hypothetical protein RhiirA1_396542 [Rhizophagus irregularis]|uniref:Uncharacterized protein n=1 Tax=Rhizophagus irregularis TaxID=588596 RepID=A0A2N0RKH2_9GLOM|nr:hypothetical protein RhiirA1_396542 [Rhizophagus irregularis]
MPDELFQSEINNLEMNKVEENSATFHSKLYDFNIPNNSDSEKLPKEFINLQINSNKIIQQQMKRKNIDNDDDEKEIIQQKSKRQNIGDIDDDDDVYNDPNLHSKEQDDLEIPDVFIVIYLFIRRVLNFPLAIS